MGKLPFVAHQGKDKYKLVFTARLKCGGTEFQCTFMPLYLYTHRII